VTHSLDTNAVIAILKEPHGRVATRLRGHAPGDIAVSSIVLHELYFGAFRSARVEYNLARVEALRFPVIALDQDDARAAGEIRAGLAARGTPIGGYDLFIAGQAYARGLVVVTANTREFARVSELAVEDWAVA